MAQLQRAVLDPLSGASVIYGVNDPSVNGLNAPVNTICLVNGVAWVKNGTNATDWAQLAAATGFLPLTGGTLTGALTVQGLVTAQAGFTVSGGTVTLPARAIADGALSTNVPLLNAANSFTAAQTITRGGASAFLQLRETASGTGNGLNWSVVADGSRFYMAPVIAGTADFGKELSFNFATTRWEFDTAPAVNNVLATDAAIIQTGQLAKARQYASTAYTDQQNNFAAQQKITAGSNHIGLLATGAADPLDRFDVDKFGENFRVMFFDASANLYYQALSISGNTATPTVTFYQPPVYGGTAFNNAGLFTTGTLADGVLSANVAMRNADNTFTNAGGSRYLSIASGGTAQYSSARLAFNQSAAQADARDIYIALEQSVAGGGGGATFWMRHQRQVSGTWRNFLQYDMVSEVLALSASTINLNASVAIPNGQRLYFGSNVAGSSAYFVGQSDNNFVFYVPDDTGAVKVVWSVSMRAATRTLNISANNDLNVQANLLINSTQVLTSARALKNVSAAAGSGVTLDASLLTSGTLLDARLSGNVPLLNAASNAFTGAMIIGTGTVPTGTADLKVVNDVRVGGTVYATNFILTGGSASGSGLTLDMLDDVAVASPLAAQVLRFDTVAGLWKNATLTYSDISGTPPISSSSSTTGRLTKWTASGQLGDSLLTESGTVVSVGGTLTATTLQQGGVNVSLTGHTHAAGDITSGQLAVANGGTGKATWATVNGIVYANGTAIGQASNTTATKMYLSQTSSGTPTFTQVAFSELASKPTTLTGYGITDALPAAGGTITGALAVNGAVTVNNTLTLGNTVTINNAVMRFTPTPGTAGWAIGAFFNDLAGNALGGVGYYGASASGIASLTRLYLAAGASPYSSGLGVYVLPSGYVGVMNTNPQAPLDVTGNAQVTGILSVIGGAQGFNLKEAGATTHAYMGWLDSSGTRKAFLGFPGNGSTVMTFTNEVTNGSFAFNANGSGAFSFNAAISAPNFILSSDRALKTDLRVIDGALAKLARVRGYTYRYRGDRTRTRRAGVIAQEVRRALPEAVMPDHRTGKLGVSYDALVPLLVEAVRELAREVQQLTAAA